MVEMIEVEQESKLHVAFSKLHSSLFTKASERCTLYNAEIVIINFIYGKKAYSLSHPCVELIIDYSKLLWSSDG